MSGFRKYTLGRYRPGAVVVLAEFRPGESLSFPGKQVTVVANYADGTGVMVVRDVNGAVFERDAHTPLFEVEYDPAWYGG